MGFEINGVNPAGNGSNNGTNGANNQAKARPQVTLDSVVQVVIKNTSKFDKLGSYRLNYNDARTGNTVSIEVSDVKDDGSVVLTVRTLSRVVYR